MKLTKLIRIDTRAAGNKMQDNEMEINEKLIKLQEQGAEILRVELKEHDSGKMVFLVLYERNDKGAKNAAKP